MENLKYTKDVSSSSLSDKSKNEKEKSAFRKFLEFVFTCFVIINTISRIFEHLGWEI
jgi:membrane-bound acyltransferase YfiQ involved in biofilm formation